MKLQNIREIVKLSFPGEADTLIDKMINNAYLEFAHKTQILTNKEDIYAIGTVAYDLTGADFAFDVDEIKRIECRESSGELTAEPLQFVIEDGYLTFYNYDGEVITTIPSPITKIDVKYSYIPAVLTEADSPVIPTEYHEALAYRVMQNLSVKNKELQPAMYYKSEWNDAITDARKRANNSQNKTTSNIKPYYF